MNSKHVNLIEVSGGEVDGIFVRRPGVQIISKTEVTEQGRDIISAMSCSEEAEGLAEFNSRITYLSYPQEHVQVKTEKYLDMLLNQLGHRSILSSYSITFLLAGVSTECCLELCAHREASVARLTSSRTKVHENPLFVCPKEMPIEHQNFLSAAWETRLSGAKSKDELEAQHRTLPASKAVSLTWTMNLKDLDKFFRGRFSPEGVEKELQDLIEVMCHLAHNTYPWAILTAQQYKDTYK